MMLASIVALVFAHVLADFVVQTRAMIAAKRHPAVFAGHIGAVVLTAFCALGAWSSARAMAAVVLIGVSHAALDLCKTWIAAPRRVAADVFGELKVFGADQFGHLLFIGLAAWLWPEAFRSGAWPALLGPEAAARLLAIFAVGAGAITATRVGDLVVTRLMVGFRAAQAEGSGGVEPERSASATTPSRTASGPGDDDAPRAGAWIGWLERALVFLLVLLGQFNAIGFVIAAKSILRFEYARKPRQSELVIIGTLASFGWAVVVALLTSAALTGLGVIGGGR